VTYLALCFAGTSVAVAQSYMLDPDPPKPPLNLGGDALNDEPSAYSPNNTGVQSAATVPSLANPFFANLITPPEDTSLKNAVPVSILKLLKAKKNTEALKEIDAALEKNPKNVQLRFIRSRIFIEQGKLEQARVALTEITEKFPELPEPYNNLAVLYATLGQLELARENLEMSLRLAPDNALALQNLGDVYSRLAASKYIKAYQLNPRLRDSDRKAKLAEAVTKPVAPPTNPPTSQTPTQSK
jgi:Flp pilus assembly protein TadD